jgi:hypothetical protein
MPSSSAPKGPDTATTAGSPAPGGPPNDYDQQRKRLEPKVWAGRGTEEDILLLKAICSHMGDRACRDRANAMLKKKHEQAN